MKNLKLSLIDENSSPLFRIMSVYNSNASNKIFANNFCAFHVGKGIIISVAHSLRAFDRLPAVISESFYQKEIVDKIIMKDRPNFSRIYPTIPGTNNRLCTDVNKNNVETYAKKLDEAKSDRRFSILYRENCCKPFLVTTFRNDAFCKDSNLNDLFKATHHFSETAINRYTFIIELELLDVLVNEDIAIYKIVNTQQNIINKLPVIKIDYNLFDTGTENYYCLQSAPYDNLGRIINEAKIEGILDNFNKETDIFGNNYTLDGIRYLIKGYFRFGSSGAPYLIFDKETNTFKVNAIQSQASFIQLAINGKMEGNLQFVNGIATPLSIVEQKLKERLAEANIS